MAKVSVIVPVYNVAQYLDKCILSLVAQTLHDIEIICINDCSTDNSYEILKKYAAQDERITVLQTKKNSGLSSARNLGLTAIHSDYIMFCDSDDWYEPTMCQDMFDLITKHKAELGICSMNTVSETGKSINNNDKRFILPEGVFAPNAPQLANTSVAVCMRIIRRDIIDKNNIVFPIGLKYEDTYFSNVYKLYTTKVATTSKKLYNYRIRGGSIMNLTSSGQTNSSLDFAKVAIQYFNYLKAHKLYTQEYFNFWTDLFIYYAQNALMYTKNKVYMRELDKILTDFISKNYVFGTTTPRTDYTMSLILDGNLMRRKKYLFGLFQTYRESTKTEYCLWKISVFKIKYLEHVTKYYLFGLCIYKKDVK